MYLQACETAGTREESPWLVAGEVGLYSVTCISVLNRVKHQLSLFQQALCTECSCFIDEAATIRVTNLSEDTRESDLQELFRPFGSISRIYLAKDKITGQSKVRGYRFPI